MNLNRRAIVVALLLASGPPVWAQAVEKDAAIAELQEKLNPGKCQPLWEKLLESNSIPALYFIGQYASRAGNKVLAAKCRYEFIQKDNMRRCIQNGMNSLFGEEGDGLMFDGFLN